MENKKILPLHKVEQFIANVRAIEELAQNSPDLQVLKGYMGFGGLSDCFWDRQLYGQLMRAIRANFGIEKEKDILENLRISTKSAYYTPKELIIFIYRYLQQVCNFKGGDILEPSCGNGAFFEHMPSDIMANSNITGVEYDILTSRLVKGIYPHINIINDGLQNINFTGLKYDLIIGNPPYGDLKMQDIYMPDLNDYTIHHYFTAKCVRLLKDNGVLVFVLPSFYLDIPKRNTRHIVDNESVIIDVVRLPSNLFAQATVTVDILFIRKTGNKLHNILNTTKYVDENGNSDCINEFWVKNRHRILGELKLKFVGKYNRWLATCETNNKQELLGYLVNCKFDVSTINNFNKVSHVNDDNGDGEQNAPDNNVRMLEKQLIKLQQQAQSISIELEQIIKQVQSYKE